MSSVEPPISPQEGSKFKRFLKRFGRRPSDDNRKTQGEGEGDEERVAGGEELQRSQSGSAAGAVQGGGVGAKNTGSMRSRKGSKGKRSDSFAGRFFQAGQHAPPLPAQQQRNGTATAGSGFGGTSGEGLAETLAIPPSSSSPAPQLAGLPTHDPIATGGLMSPSQQGNRDSSKTSQENESSRADGDVDRSSLTAAGQRNGLQSDGEVHSAYGSSLGRRRVSSDAGSSDGGVRGRDSLDNRTMDTGKSRASTKPTTLMSLDAPDHGQGSYLPMAQIAQHRHGDSFMSSGGQVASTRSNNSEGQTNGVPSSSSIQFAPQPPLGRTASGTIVQLPGVGEGVDSGPYMNVPALSRPHPSNNPLPAGIPADNASMLTLASSTAPASIGGGGASSRGHSHATPSLGGARSIAGEKRNSSDTYASVKALPPLSRRGSDSSSRTGKSVAASATGRNSAQAMMGPAATGALAGPGAPFDRISLHRTPSQKTIATQLSIPISTSNQVLSGNPDAGSTAITGLESSGTSSLLPSITTTAPSHGELGSSEAVKAHADKLAASSS